MQLLEKLGLCVKAEADSLVKVGVGLDPRRVGPKPNQVGPMAYGLRERPV